MRGKFRGALGVVHAGAPFGDGPIQTELVQALQLVARRVDLCIESGAVRLPFDVATGELVPDVWARWLRWDPVRMARTPDGADALRSLRAIYIDAGTRDEYHLDLGAEAFRAACVAAGTSEPVFELFDAKHGGIEYRYPLALRYLAERLG